MCLKISKGAVGSGKPYVEVQAFKNLAEAPILVFINRWLKPNGMTEKMIFNGGLKSLPSHLWGGEVTDNAGFSENDQQKLKAISLAVGCCHK